MRKRATDIREGKQIYFRMVKSENREVMRKIRKVTEGYLVKSLKN